MCKVDSDRASIRRRIKVKGTMVMAECILGVDIATRRFDVALLVNDKLKHKVFTNSQNGFKELLTWLKRQVADRAHVCMEAASTYGDELAACLYDAG